MALWNQSVIVYFICYLDIQVSAFLLFVLHTQHTHQRQQIVYELIETVKTIHTYSSCNDICLSYLQRTPSSLKPFFLIISYEIHSACSYRMHLKLKGIYNNLLLTFHQFIFYMSTLLMVR